MEKTVCVHATGDDPAIEVVGLQSQYGSRLVLQDISFAIPRHRVSVIMGVSGCGKSTLLRHLVALKSTPHGRILVDGKSLAEFNEEELYRYRRQTGVLFQSGALFNSLSVAENIAVPLRAHTRLADETIRIIAQIKLHQVGLMDFADYMPSQLSGGMRKRAGLARALAMDPAILFVDELSSGLDPITSAGLDDLILELRETLRMTIIVVTHELESAFRIADQLIVLDRGRLVAAGKPEEIRSCQDERVAQFLSRRADPQEEDMQNYVNRLVGDRRGGKGGRR
jgi:phospholipid/cholesterol/gamma-HCH transport system ATP-binding protein